MRPGMFYGGIIGLIASLLISFYMRTLALQYYAMLNLVVSLIPCVLFSFIAIRCGYEQSESKIGWVWSEWRKRKEFQVYKIKNNGE